MNHFQGCLFLLIVVSAADVLSLNPRNFDICDHNAPCRQHRGLIHYDWSSFSFYEKYLFGGRSWTVRPDSETPTTITVVFKDFNVLGSIFVKTISPDKTQWREIRPSLGNNFELIVSDVTSLTFYVPRNERGRFQAYYYVGCKILTASKSEIDHPSIDNHGSTCWIVKPIGVRDMSRIYFTMRDVYLQRDASVVIEELHTNTIVGDVNNRTAYEIFGTDTVGHEIILIDLRCGEKHGPCNKFGNLFSISYYTVDRRDVRCIETQRECALEPEHVTTQQCLRPCPMLENIIAEEFVKEGPGFLQQTPILKSGIIRSGRIVYNSSKENKTKNEEENSGDGPTDAEETEDETVRDSRIAKKPKPKPVRCSLKRKKYCKCLRTVNDARKYCFSKRKCKTFGFCSYGCFWARIILCAKMTSATSIKLLSG